MGRTGLDVKGHDDDDGPKQTAEAKTHHPSCRRAAPPQRTEAQPSAAVRGEQRRGRLVARRGEELGGPICHSPSTSNSGDLHFSSDSVTCFILP